MVRIIRRRSPVEYLSGNPIRWEVAASRLVHPDLIYRGLLSYVGLVELASRREADRATNVGRASAGTVIFLIAGRPNEQLRTPPDNVPARLLGIMFSRGRRPGKLRFLVAGAGGHQPEGTAATAAPFKKF